MRNFGKNMLFLCAVTALLLCFSMGAAATSTVDANITIDAQSENAFILPFQNVDVNSGLAESYGYSDTVDSAQNVSALDVLVKLHEIKYGDTFTLANCNDYLVVDSGVITKAFGNAASDWDVAVNGEGAHGDVLGESGYDSYLVNQTPVVTGDLVEILAYQDPSCDEQYLWTMENDDRVDSLDVKSDDIIDLTIKGYRFSDYGNYGTDTIKSTYLSALSGAQLALMAEDGTLTDIEGAVSDENGNVSLSFDDCGTYTVVAYLPAATNTHAFLSVLTVNVHKMVKASVYTDVQMDGSFAVPYQMVRVHSDFAESYGYTDDVPFWENVSALDVLVKLNKMKYGDAFTAETCQDYLTVTDGSISKAFGDAGSDWGIALNGEGAHSDEVTGDGGYQGYLVNQTVVTACDVVEFLQYQDPSRDEQYLWMMQNGNHVDFLKAAEGENIDLSLAGYLFSSYSCYGTAAIKDTYLSSVSGLQLAVMSKKGVLTDINGAVTDENGDVTFSFHKKGAYTIVAYLPGETGANLFMPVVTVNVYKEKKANGMSDLVHGRWYYNSISAMLSQGLMEGVSETEFDPEGTVTRGMFVTILYRYAGSPNCTTEIPFSDVSAEAYYANAVAWAYENEITGGITATKFAPNDNITREQMAAMLVRFADVVGYDLPYGDGTALFDDDNSISPYANQAVYRLVKAGVIKGMGQNKFAPRATATRAQASEMIYQLQNMK